jgi:AcrR family transcriptional regulator
LVRARVIAAAEAVVRRDGFLGLTIDAVASEADISKPSVYYYFASKEELAWGLVVARSEIEMAFIGAAIAKVEAGSSVVSAVVRAYAKHHLQSLELFRAEYVWAQVSGLESARVDDAINPGMNTLFSAFERRLSEDADAGRLHHGLNLRRVAVSTWMAAHGLVATLSLLDAGGTKLRHGVRDMVEQMCSMLTRGVYTDLAL